MVSFIMAPGGMSSFLEPGRKTMMLRDGAEDVEYDSIW